MKILTKINSDHLCSCFSGEHSLCPYAERYFRCSIWESHFIFLKISLEIWDLAVIAIEMIGLLILFQEFYVL